MDSAWRAVQNKDRAPFLVQGRVPCLGGSCSLLQYVIRRERVRLPISVFDADGMILLVDHLQGRRWLDPNLPLPQVHGEVWS